MTAKCERAGIIRENYATSLLLEFLPSNRVVLSEVLPGTIVCSIIMEYPTAFQVMRLMAENCHGAVDKTYLTDLRDALTRWLEAQP